ncbi:MAG: phosphoribosylglycinamide formyltransferase [Planctomycetota bacterium]|jgi:formyltetrahydrofolate-dependent phosphoribosylglycinamide formyltransferase
MASPTQQITAYIDGGSRGNPGPAAASFILNDKNGNQLQAKAFYIGKTTNNVAEYTAIVKALEAVSKMNAENLIVYSDSQLLVKQLNGEYKVKSQQIKPLFEKTLSLLREVPNWKVQHVNRQKNKEADKLLNQALNLEQDVVAENSKFPANVRAIRLAVLISGSGRTLMNILDYIKAGRLNAKIPLVISSRLAVAGVEKAKAAGMNVKIIRKKDFPDIEQFSKCIEEELVASNVDLVIQAGWLCLWKIPQKYKNSVMNVHPALLPSFGGQGMWGHHVHEAVLAAGCKVTGCTVHFCTNEYDKGPIILQRCCPVEENDKPETLAERVFEAECIAYPQAIKLFAEGRILVKDEKVKIKS